MKAAVVSIRDVSKILFIELYICLINSHYGLHHMKYAKLTIEAFVFPKRLEWIWHKGNDTDSFEPSHYVTEAAHRDPATPTASQPSVRSLASRSVAS